MIEIERLMTQRADDQHELAIRRHTPAGKRPGKRLSVGALRAHIASLTARINAILARNSRGKHGKTHSTRNRAKKFLLRSLSQFGKSESGPCPTCRAMAATLTSEVWTETDCGCIASPDHWYRSLTITTEPGDIVVLDYPACDLDVRMAIKCDGGNNQSGWRSGWYEHIPSPYHNEFVSSGGTYTISIQNFEPIIPDAHANHKFCIKLRHKKPNLVAIQPFINDPDVKPFIDGTKRWVGFGYYIENNRWDPQGQRIMASLYYARLEGGVFSVRGGPVRENGMQLQEGAYEDWNAGPNCPGPNCPWRIGFADMGVPPDSATHIATVIDVEGKVAEQELRTDDNREYTLLPNWEAKLSWVNPKHSPVPISVFAKSKEADRFRWVVPYQIGVVAQENIWKQQWQAARSRCFLRIYVTSDRTGWSAGKRGWVFPPSYGSRLQQRRILIKGDEYPIGGHKPVNRLEEEKKEIGIGNKGLEYLEICCSELDRGTSTLFFWYIPAAGKGVDTLRVELWDYERIQPVQIATPIEQKIAAIETYTLKWLNPPDKLPSSFLLRDGFDVKEQPDRAVVPKLLQLQPRLNGRDLGPGHEVRLKISPKPDESGPTAGLRGWVFPKSYDKALKRKPLRFNASKKGDYPGINEPVKEQDLLGVLNAKYKSHTFEVNDKGLVEFLYLPPCRGGWDVFKASLYSRKGTHVLVKADDREIKLQRCGVRQLILRAPGSTVSKPYLLLGATWPTPVPGGVDDFHFAPGPQLDAAGQLNPSLVDQVEVSYEISNAAKSIRLAELRLVPVADGKPVWARKLKDSELTHGWNTLQFDNLPYWDGKISAHSDFPVEYVTAEHSPYELRLYIIAWDGTCDSPEAWTQFKVEVAEVTLELGPKMVLPMDQPPPASPPKDYITPGSHRAVYDTLNGALPAPGQTQEIKLLGNLFKTDTSRFLGWGTKQGNDEMYDNSGFEHHKTQWGDGPLIPIFARLRLKDSNNALVDAPLGLGKVKCLWDWEGEAKDAGTDTALLNGAPKTFVESATGYYVSSTKPQGRNCHLDRGGKRTPDGATASVFPQQAGYEHKDALDDGVFPFQVEAAGERKWAALSIPWRQGVLAGKTGVLFQPSRMAGDVLRVVCYAAQQKGSNGNLVLDVDTDLSGQLVPKDASGYFEVWRKHVINRYIKKKAFGMSIPVANVQAYFREAFIDLSEGYIIEKIGIEAMDSTKYNGAVATAVAALGDPGMYAVDPAVDQYATGDCCVNFRTRKDFLEAKRVASNWTAADLNSWLNGQGAVYDSDDKYEVACANCIAQPPSWGWAGNILEAICNAYLPGKDGVTLFQFCGMHNIGKQGNLNGAAVDLRTATRQQVGFITCAIPGAYSGSRSHNSLEQTTTHEIGHHLFMPHSPDGVGPSGGAAPDMHDQDQHNCMMSYNWATAPRQWCGLCILRLRGWDKTLLNKDGTLNSHS